ncbi:MAG: hypothetical protein ACJ8HJ_02945 [Massilia sp.]
MVRHVFSMGQQRTPVQKREADFRQIGREFCQTGLPDASCYRMNFVQLGHAE